MQKKIIHSLDMAAAMLAKRKPSLFGLDPKHWLNLGQFRRMMQAPER